MIGFITSFLSGTRLGRFLSALVFAAGILAAAFFYGRQVEEHAQEVEDLVDYKKTREVIDEVEHSSDRDAAIERLRDNGHIR